MNYREMRTAERSKYLEINGRQFPDIKERWRAYENLILDRFWKEVDFPDQTREEALDQAWLRRDHYNTWASNRRVTSAPISEHGKRAGEVLPQ